MENKINIPTVSTKLAKLKLQEKLEAYNQARAEIQIIRQTVQDELMDYLWDNYSIDPMLWFYNPDEPYFRMMDHKERGMQQQDYIRIIMNESNHEAHVVNAQIGSHLPTRCKNISILADTVKKQSHLLYVLQNDNVQKMISDGYQKMKNTIKESKSIIDYQQAARDAQYFETAAEFCASIVDSGINTSEKIEDWIDSLETEQAQVICQNMELLSLTISLNKKQDLKKIIQHFFCLPDDYEETTRR